MRRSSLYSRSSRRAVRQGVADYETAAQSEDTAMRTFRVSVEQEILVTIDEAKFDESFLKEFRESFYQFLTLEEHVRHLAQLRARGLMGDFVEGYGKTHEMGILAETDDTGHFEIGEPAAAETPALHLSIIDLQRQHAAAEK